LCSEIVTPDDLMAEFEAVVKQLDEVLRDLERAELRRRLHALVTNQPVRANRIRALRAPRMA